MVAYMQYVHFYAERKKERKEIEQVKSNGKISLARVNIVMLRDKKRNITGKEYDSIKCI